MRIRTGLLSAAALMVPILLPALPAQAQNDGYGYHYQDGGDSGLSTFAGLRGSIVPSGSVHTNIPTAPPVAASASYNTGGGGSVYAGVRLPLGFRAELEGLYRDLPLTSVSLAGTSAPIKGQIQMGGGMANLYWDFPVSDFPLRPFVGAGLGGVFTAIDAKDSSNTYFRSNSWHLGYEFMAGAEVPLSQSSRITAMYRWLRVNDLDLKCGTSGLPTDSCKPDLTTQGFDLGLEMDL